MSRASAAFFSWLQTQPFYAGLHTQAVNLLPDGAGRRWLDVGCGPGLLTRLACEHGYEAVGLDRDPAMIEAAKRLARERSGCGFDTGDLEHATTRHRADVVSASSLLFVVPDPALALAQLWRSVLPGGHLLVLETTDRMTLRHALTNRMPRERGRLALCLWGYARGGQTVSDRVFDAVPAASRTRTPLLNGMVHAWIFVKGTG